MGDSEPGPDPGREPDRGTSDAARLAIAVFARQDPADMALAGGGSLDRATGAIRLRYCGLALSVSHPGASVAVLDAAAGEGGGAAAVAGPAPPASQAPPPPTCGRPSPVAVQRGLHDLGAAEAVLVLQYLAARGALPPRGRWLSFLELPGGPHHHDLFVTEAIAPLALRFGPDPTALAVAAAALGGQAAALGHGGAIVPAFPRLPLAFMVWRGDAEFPPRANLLFDAVAPHYLSTASLFVLGIEASARLRRAAGR